MRAIPIRSGRTETKNEQGDLFRCPKCGFVNYWSKTATPGYAAINVGDVSIPSIVFNNGLDTYERNKLCTLEAVDFHGCTVKFGDDGVTGIGVYYTPRYYQANAGCRFCGQVNL